MAVLISSAGEPVRGTAVGVFHSYLLCSFPFPPHSPAPVLHLPQAGWLAHLVTVSPWLHLTLALPFTAPSTRRQLSELSVLHSVLPPLPLSYSKRAVGQFK